MTLKPTDLHYINHRMETYDIKYQEVYDELYDHMISAVETARKDGDTRNIVPLFDDMLEAQFPGYWAFERISKQYEKAYRKKIRKAIWVNFKGNINWQSILATAILVGIGFYLPHTKTASLTLFISLGIVAIIPMFYSWIKSRKMYLANGKQSIVKNYVMLESSLLTFIMQMTFNLSPFLSEEFNITILNPVKFHPAIFMLLLSFFMVYGLSAMQLCRQELKLADK